MRIFSENNSWIFALEKIIEFSADIRLLTISLSSNWFLIDDTNSIDNSTDRIFCYAREYSSFFVRIYHRHCHEDKISSLSWGCHTITIVRIYYHYYREDVPSLLSWECHIVAGMNSSLLSPIASLMRCKSCILRFSSAIPPISSEKLLQTVRFESNSHQNVYLPISHEHCSFSSEYYACFAEYMVRKTALLIRFRWVRRGEEGDLKGVELEYDRKREYYAKSTFWDVNSTLLYIMWYYVTRRIECITVVTRLILTISPILHHG